MKGADKEQTMGTPRVVALEGAANNPDDPAAQASSGASPGRADPDIAIAQAIDAGDTRKALLFCARAYGPIIGRLSMSMLGSQADAEDVSQETLLDAHDGFAGWRREGSMRGWLLTIARRKCARLIDKKVKRTAKLRLVHDAAQQPQSDAAADKQVILRQRASRARLALEEIRPSEREALLLRYGAGLSFREVGEACGIDEAAARKRVSRGIARLRQKLSQEGTEQGAEQ
jgi:RNA polymerase sigma-70 factor (ECF subfamily)